MEFQTTFNEEENSKMKTEKIQIKVRSKFGVEKEIVRNYSFPETLKEGIELDGDDSVFAVYSVKRKSNFMDDERRKELVKIEKPLTEALNDPEKAAKIRAILGI